MTELEALKQRINTIRRIAALAWVWLDNGHVVAI